MKLFVMKLFVRIIICLITLSGGGTLFWFGLKVLGGHLAAYRKASGAAVLLLSLALFALGVSLLYVLVNDIRYIIRFGYGSFVNATRESSAHKALPFFRRGDK